MAPAVRLALACELSEEARTVSLDGIRQRRPEFTYEQAVDLQLDVLLGRELAERVRAHRTSRR